MDEYLQYCTIIVQIILTYHTMQILQSKNTWNVKKGQGQEEPATKSSDIKKPFIKIF